MNDDAFDGVDPGQLAAGLGWDALDLQVTAAVIKEFREPGFLTAARQRVLPPGGLVSGRAAIHRAVRPNQFGGKDSDAGTGGPFCFEADHDGRVLSEIINHGVGADGMRLNRLEYFKRAQRRCRAGKPREFSTRPMNDLRGTPCGVVESRFAPAGRIQPGVIVFAAIGPKEPVNLV